VEEFLYGYGFRVGSDDASGGGGRGLDPLPASQNSVCGKEGLHSLVFYFFIFLQAKMSPKIVEKPFCTWSGSS